MKTLFLSLTVLFATVNITAQSAEDSVKTTINNLFAAMKNADQSLFKTVFSDSAILQTITRDKEGKTIVT